MKVYLVEFMRDTSLGLTQEQRESVVLNVPDLLAVHKPFVQSLEAVAKEHGITGSMDVEVNGPATEKLAVDAIALCFLKVVSCGMGLRMTNFFAQTISISVLGPSIRRCLPDILLGSCRSSSNHSQHPTHTSVRCVREDLRFHGSQSFHISLFSHDVDL